MFNILIASALDDGFLSAFSDLADRVPGWLLVAIGIPVAFMIYAIGCRALDDGGNDYDADQASYDHDTGKWDDE